MKLVRSGKPATDSGKGLSRSELAALYGGTADVRENTADPGLLHVRDTLTHWVNRPVDRDCHDRLRRAAMLAAQSADSEQVQVAPVSGFTWILRKGSGRPIPVSSVIAADAETRVAVPERSRAQFHYPDDSLVLIDGGSELEVGRLGRGKAAARLGRGRIFAWVAPQSGGAFGIRTHHATVSVVGTEFDLGVLPSGALDLVVAGGTVHYSARESGRTHSLSAGQWLSASGGSSTVRPLTPVQLRAKTAWARNGDPRHRGGGWRKAAVALLVVITALVAYQNRDRLGERRSETGKLPAAVLPSGGSLAVVPVQFNGNTATFRSPLVPGTAQSLSIQIDDLKDGKYQPELDIALVTRAVEGRADGSVKTDSAIQVNMVGRPQATPIQGIESWICPDGRLEGIRVSGTDKLDANSIYYCVRVATFVWTRCLPDHPVQPGDTYQREISGKFEQHPTASFSAQHTIRYEGLVQEGGVTLAKFTFSGVSAAGGIIMDEKSAYGRTQQTRMEKWQSQEAGAFYVDTSTGRIVRGESQDRSEWHCIKDAPIRTNCWDHTTYRNTKLVPEAPSPMAAVDPLILLGFRG